jgi:hypothetical protein
MTTTGQRQMSMIKKPIYRLIIFSLRSKMVGVIVFLINMTANTNYYHAEWEKVAMVP